MASASPPPTSMTMAGWTCTWRTTRIRARSIATTATAPSPTSASAPAAPSVRMASRRPAWASRSATTIATARSTSSRPTSPATRRRSTRNSGTGFCEDRTFAAGIGVNTRYLGWGVGFLDLDLDGWLDLFLVNGHVYPEVKQLATEAPYQQRKVIYRGLRQRPLRRHHRSPRRARHHAQSRPRRRIRRSRQRRRHRHRHQQRPRHAGPVPPRSRGAQRRLRKPLAAPHHARRHDFASPGHRRPRPRHRRRSHVRRRSPRRRQLLRAERFQGERRTRRRHEGRSHRGALAERASKRCSPRREVDRFITLKEGSGQRKGTALMAAADPSCCVSLQASTPARPPDGALIDTERGARADRSRSGARGRAEARAAEGRR